MLEIDYSTTDNYTNNFTALILFSQTQDMNSKIIYLMLDFSICLLYFCY